MKTFEEVYENMCQRAQEVFLESEYHAPIFLIHSNGKTDVIGAEFGNNVEKQALYAALSQRYKGVVEWYIFITEGWFTSTNKDQPWDGTPPSENPNRRECLLVVGGTKDGVEKDTQWEIFRDPLRLGEKEELENNYSAIRHALFGGEECPTTSIPLNV